MSEPSAASQLLETIKTLNTSVWNGRVPGQRVTEWLNRFSGGPDEHLHALFMLSQMIYFGDAEIREALRSIFRDLVRYPLVADLRRANSDTTDSATLENLFIHELSLTRFLGMGNPSESGTHLLYFFRQENGLGADLFIHTHQIFSRVSPSATTATAPSSPQRLRRPEIRRYIFLDDLCASGSQAVEYSREQVAIAKSLDPTLQFYYFPIVASRVGIERVRAETAFNRVEALFEIDESYKCFTSASRHFAAPPPGVTQDAARLIAESYGKLLEPTQPLGFGDGQLLLSFHHNTPDNTLPIMWSDTNGWLPPFRRYPKLYWSNQ